MTKIIIEKLENGNFRITTIRHGKIDTERCYEQAMNVISMVRELLNLLRPKLERQIQQRTGFGDDIDTTAYFKP